jgi:uncharacterized protein (TIGR03437 family)
MIQLEAESLSAASNGTAIPIQVSSSALTSDTNQDNSVASTVVTLDYVTLTVSSTLGCQFSIDGQLYQSGYNTMVFAPNSSVTIAWPSPQVCGSGLAEVFQNWSDGSTANPRTFALGTSNVTASANFQFLFTPFVSPGGIGNAGSYANDGVSPGEIVTIYGFNLGGSLTTAQVNNGLLATQLGTTQVLFDGTAAPLVYVSSTAVAAIVPYDVAGNTSTSVVVQAGTAKSTAVQIPVVDAEPGLFTANASGTGQAAALNQDGSLNSTSNPAQAGDIIVLWGTGEGLVSPLPANGAIAGVPAPKPLLQITVTIGGIDAQVLYAAGAPDETAGVIQINARIPAGLPSNHHTPVEWSAGQKPSQTGVTIAIE